MNADELNRLADRCEAATGPDRKLDADIAKAMGASRLYARGNPKWHFTASLDAAMTLVPEGRVILNIAEDGITTAIVDGTQGCSATPALALTAACLRAIAAQPEQPHPDSKG